MSQIPKSRLTSRDMTHMIGRVKVQTTNEAIMALKTNERFEKISSRQFLEAMLMSFLSDEIKKKISDLKSKGCTRMDNIVRALATKQERDIVMHAVINAVKDYDNDGNNERKLNPKNAGMDRLIELMYNRYMIEQILRFRAKNMKANGMSAMDISVRLNPNNKKSNYNIDAREIRLYVRDIVRGLYDADEKEQKVDKLREETRKVMKALAKEIEVKGIESKENLDSKLVVANLEK